MRICATPGPSCARRSDGEGGFVEQARQIAGDLLRLCVRVIHERTLLLPAPHGFLTADQVIINPSYYVFPALDALRSAFPHPAWTAVTAHGELLLEEARFGRWALPADWIVLRQRGSRPEPQRGRGDRFGDDALRVPLYLAWSGRWQAGSIQAVRAFWNATSHPALPGWVRLSDGALAPYAGGAGVTAIHQLLIRGGEQPALAAFTRPAGRGYYHSALALLADAAMRETAALPAAQAAAPLPQRGSETRSSR